MKTRHLSYVMAAALLLAGTVFGEAQQINISGATLFQDFFRSYASTNDYVDVDGDGHKGFNWDDLATPDQLAYDYPSTNLENRWYVLYRGVGSGNGLKDLVTYARRSPGMEIGNPSEGAGLINRATFYNNGVVGWGNADNPGSAPLLIKNIDIATMDVPTTWFVQAGNPLNAGWNRGPFGDGYGCNPLKDWGSSSQSNKLKTLVSALDPNVVLNINTANPDRNTVFDTQIAWVPIAIIANQGTGLQNVTVKDLQHLFVTGRMPTGENLVAATRDAGSGTRNGSMNSLGIDPSWARGDNTSKKIGTDGDNGRYTNKLGAGFQASNLGGSGLMETAVQYNRLAVGYTGLMGSSRAEGDATNGYYEILNVKKAGAYVRPNIVNVLDTLDPNTGCQIGGSETFATVGNPFAAGQLAMDNPAAAAYIRNIAQSINDFVTAPDNPQYDMPGEFLATQFTLVAGLNGVPVDATPSVFVANPKYNANVNAYIKAHTKLNVPAFGSTAIAGKCPVRAQLTNGGTYSDGRTYLGADDYYTDSSGAQIKGNVALSKRNRIMGDFNYDGERNYLDCSPMMQAYAHPRLFEAGNDNNGDGYVIVEVIGDFNADGSFDANDIRYWADGLILNPVTGHLDRSFGFALVDACWTPDLADANHPAGNFFNTKLATGRAYLANSGWSKADVAGKGKPQPGAGPVAADGRIDAKDIDYVCTILRGGLEADAFGFRPAPVAQGLVANSLAWADLDQAVWMDLSCDMNGDLVVDRSDVDVIVHQILGTEYGDVNLDGKVDSKDLDIIKSNLSDTAYGKGWADGDVNGDGYVTSEDLDLAFANLSK